MTEAVLFDLDDTLYPQAQWLEGAWTSVCSVAMGWDIDPELLGRSLRSVAAEGSASGNIIDRALALLGIGHVPVADLVAAFRSHAPPTLAPYPGARRLVDALKRRVPIGLVTDGDETTQCSKLRALGLEGTFDVVVYADRLGRRCRKPHPAPFMSALDELAVAPEGALFIGDHPVKDVEGPQAVGMRSVRVRTGEYSAMTGSVRPWASFASIADIPETLVGSGALR